MIRAFPLGLLLALLVACAPGTLPPGDPDISPRLTATAFLASDGTALPLRRWEPAGQPKALVLALHGFNDYSSFFHTTAEALADQGILSMAYDQRGFGANEDVGYWAGVAGYTRDMREAIAAARQTYPELPLFVLGESMGGAVALVTLSAPNAPAVDGVILSAPAVWARKTWPFYQRWALWLGAHSLPWLPVSGRGLNIKPSDNIEMLRALGRDPLIIKDTRIGTIWGLANLMDSALEAVPRFDRKALILYGSKDEIIPGKPFDRLVATLPDDARLRQTLALYDGGWHMLLRDLNADLVHADIAAWIEDATQPLPSAADMRARLRLRRPY
ncbi:alpha/beta hydrolase [Magnetospira sp. QH-2]|uniref:alpha/beta hydrolase n=1 Tax=Magnetospira sp. (strain QH-2) TaxID=1288970 RepID=UPI0003E817C1|nr:alpha/beta hydrolase [Magnetospira sp. QH-2]CCQ75346.1 putative Lysophospholipase [Magnetospira sp. QH-2]